LENRFDRGFIAGVIGGLVMNIWSFWAGFINFTELRMVDWAGIMFYGHTPPFSLIETVVAFFLQLAFSGVLGVLFTYLIPLLTSHNLYFKGLVFGSTVWFFIYAVSTLFRVPGTIPSSVGTVLSNLLAALLFGLVTSYVLKMSYATAAQPMATKMTAVPARKPLKQNDDDQNNPNKN